MRMPPLSTPVSSSIVAMILSSIRGTCDQYWEVLGLSEVILTPAANSGRITGNSEVAGCVRRRFCVQLVYKKAGLKGLKMDLSNAELTTDS
jgi:hypothetical protein